MMQAISLNLITLAVMIHMAVGCNWHHRHAGHVCVDHVGQSSSGIEMADLLGHETADCRCETSQGDIGQPSAVFQGSGSLDSVDQLSSDHADHYCHDDHCVAIELKAFEFASDPCVVFGSVEILLLDQSAVAWFFEGSDSLDADESRVISTAGLRPHLFYNVQLI